MITAEQVRSITFEKQNMGGYKRIDVDAFLQEVAETIHELETAKEAAEAEKNNTESKLIVLAQKIEEYRKDEDNVKTALINAQRMADSIVKEARQKADSILREANMKAEYEVQMHQGEIESQKAELKRVQEEVSSFKNDILQLYKQHIELLSELPESDNSESELDHETEEPTIPTNLEGAVISEPKEESPVKENAFIFDEPAKNQEEDKLDEISFDIPEVKIEPITEPEKPAAFSFDSFEGIKFSD